MLQPEPPENIRQEINELRADLDTAIPSKIYDRNLLIATWNIKEFGDLNENWETPDGGRPRRDLQSLLCIREIISRFDIVAVQEVTGNLKALRYLVKMLGPDWSFLLTDTNKGGRGGGERLAFLFDTRRVKLSGLACEVCIPDEYLKSRAFSLDRQFARSPYGAGFHASGKTFVLLTLHIYYGNTTADRIDELKGVATWARNWAEELYSWDHSLIVLGDFNIERKDDAAHQAFTSTGLYTPEQLRVPPRGIADGKQSKDKFYDQLSWFNNGKQTLSMEFRNGGSYNFKNKVLKSRNYKATELQWRISDHLPLWAEFKI